MIQVSNWQADKEFVFILIYLLSAKITFECTPNLWLWLVFKHKVAGMLHLNPGLEKSVCEQLSWSGTPCSLNSISIKTVVITKGCFLFPQITMHGECAWSCETMACWPSLPTNTQSDSLHPWSSMRNSSMKLLASSKTRSTLLHEVVCMSIAMGTRVAYHNVITIIISLSIPLQFMYCLQELSTTCVNIFCVCEWRQFETTLIK